LNKVTKHKHCNENKEGIDLEKEGLGARLFVSKVKFVEADQNMS